MRLFAPMQFHAVPLSSTESIAGIFANPWRTAAHIGSATSLLSLVAVCALAIAAILLIKVYRQRRRIRQAELRLRRAEKLEAIGRLAGGIAHDFNNLLTVIIGRTELLLRRDNLDPAVVRNVSAVNESARRASGLVRQLLAYSRRQVLQPTLLDLNYILQRMCALLRPLIAEPIELVLRPAAGLWPMHADESQIEQVIMNLALNARDAMPNGGQLVLETNNVVIRSAADSQLREDDLADTRAAGKFNPGKPKRTQAARAPRTMHLWRISLVPETRQRVWPANEADAQLDLANGAYVELIVSDTGIGMSPEVLECIFEPFFTTKETGKGTGLGLSTVYGIVKQSRGDIRVVSAPERGTTFFVYLPALTNRPMPSTRPESLGIAVSTQQSALTQQTPTDVPGPQLTADC
jgi:signal transduction histidine kinase